MPTLQDFRCKDCEHEFSDLPEDVIGEAGDINAGTGELESKRDITAHQCPDCGSSNVEKVKKGK